MLTRSTSDRSSGAATRTSGANHDRGGRPTLGDEAAWVRLAELRHYRDGMGRWLSDHDWHHFVTLTDDYGNGPESLLRHGLRFVRRLESKAQRRVDYYMIIEGARRDFPHLHGLLLGTELLDVREIKSWWRLGWSCVRKFDPNRGAASYVAKELAHAEFDADLYAFRLPREPDHERPRRRSRTRRRNRGSVQRASVTRPINR